MKKILLPLLLLSAVQAAYAQPRTTQPKTVAATGYDAIDKKMLEIPVELTASTKDVASYINANFTREKDKVRAIFIWTASSFEYDVDNMFALNLHEKKEEKINKIMKLRKGICENYAAVFNDLCQRCGITAAIVGGYTRQNGQTSDLPHAWCAAVVDGEWYVFDPTWGSGYINGKKFTRRIDNSFFMRQPADMLKSHMPFDPMWQLVNYPITAGEFADGNTAINNTKPYFSYRDSIAAWNRMDHLQQMETEARRTEQNGIKTGIGYNYLAYLKNNIEVERRSGIASIYNDAVSDYNDAVNDFNVFINFYNKQFTPTKTDAQIQAMLDSPYARVVRVRQMLNTIDGKDAEVDKVAMPLRKSVGELNAKLDEYKEFLRTYFPKSKLGRKAMFYTKR